MTGSRNGQSVKTKIWTSQPSKLSVSRLIDKYDCDYGGYLSYTFTVDGKPVTKSEFLGSPLTFKAVL